MNQGSISELIVCLSEHVLFEWFTSVLNPTVRYFSPTFFLETLFCIALSRSNGKIDGKQYTLTPASFSCIRYKHPLFLNFQKVWWLLSISNEVPMNSEGCSLGTIFKSCFAKHFLIRWVCTSWIVLSLFTKGIAKGVLGCLWLPFVSVDLSHWVNYRIDVDMRIWLAPCV